METNDQKPSLSGNYGDQWREYLIDHKHVYSEYHEKEITLSNGNKSNYFFDLKSTLIYNCFGMQRIGCLAGEGLKRLTCKMFFGIMRGGDVIAASLAHEVQCPCGAIDIDEDEVYVGQHDIRFMDHIVLVDDVVTTLESVRKASDLLKSEKEISEHSDISVFCIVDRRIDKKDNEGFKNIFSIFNFDEATGKLTRGTI